MSSSIKPTLTGDPLDVAPRLLNAVLTHEGVSIRITEVEAYRGEGEDPGSHAHRGRTPRNAVMFGPVGHLYVYFTYGMHWCANVVAHEPNRAGAVLLRAGEVISGLEIARRNRTLPENRLASGPARLAVALGLTGEHNGLALDGLLSFGTPVSSWTSTPRTGVSGAGAAHMWRFHLPDEPSVLPYRPARARRPRSN